MLENSLYILITMTGIYSAAALFGCLHILKWRGLRMGLLGGLLLLAAVWAGHISLASLASLAPLYFLLLRNGRCPGSRGNFLPEVQQLPFFSCCHIRHGEERA